MTHVSIALLRTMAEFDLAFEDDDDRGTEFERAPSARTNANAALRIHALRGDASIAPHHLRNAADPYTDDGRALTIYADAHGTEYWYDPERDAIVHAGPGPGGDPTPPATRPADRLPVAELRAIAETYATRMLADFPGRKASLHPLEDNLRRDLYFFRWDDLSRPCAESEMPPFLQVAVRANGAFHSCTCTLGR